MDADRVAGVVEERVPEARAEVHPSGDGRFTIVVVSPRFEGMAVADQHQLVHGALDEFMDDEIRAIEVTTLTPAEIE